MASFDFPANAEDERIIRAALREGERPSDVLRRALRLLQREMWHDRMHARSRPAMEDLTDDN
ncbi:hypothetical protein ITP53_12380 [Nonomuraea sp. K274]|uniref:Antitoxin ParD1/3/4 n=1 Tax=Nonomuraea cypriaca TaxID=1187855 RepID=A0A931A7C7_9ACTN|nr:hypothetical protein [Nonomuraea cypriaca]MBF8186523.1 hypothetical protein [Nonomuraea cypriaca]